MTFHAKNSQVFTVFDEGIEHPGSSLYTSALANSLRRLLPDPFFFDSMDEERKEEALYTFEKELPLLKWKLRGDNLSLFFLSKNKFNISKIFYDMVCQWLIPGQKLDVSFFFATDFKLINLSDQIFSLAEMVVHLPPVIDIPFLENNLHVIETEIRLGMLSFYHTNRVLEVHGVRSHEKQAYIQEKIVELIQKRPEEIDYDIFGEMQHFFVMSQDAFKAEREVHYLSRLIALFYLFRKSIIRSAERERHIRLKIAPVNLHLPWGVKKVLGICVGLNFLKSNELFEEKHLIKALKNAIPAIKPVLDSFFVNEGGEERIHTLYIEIEKENGEEFSQEEIRRLKISLPAELKDGIAVALQALFMPRNEEEVMRHIVTLAKELRFIKDLPQVILSFDEQTNKELCFTVILVRSVFPKSETIAQKFGMHETFLTYVPERVKRVGMLRKKYPKEASVFRVRMPSSTYIRADESLDLFKARQSVIEELQKVVGEIRDYNGGMIAKQLEILSALKNSLEDADEFLVETFFHSIFPVEMRSILSFGQIKILFLLWRELLESPAQEEVIKIEKEMQYVMARKEISLIEEGLFVVRLTYRETKFFGGVYKNEMRL